MPRVESRIKEFQDMGVPFVWLIDPLTRGAWIYTSSGKKAASDGMLQTASPNLEISLQELFQIADRR